MHVSSTVDAVARSSDGRVRCAFIHTYKGDDDDVGFTYVHTDRYIEEQNKQIKHTHTQTQRVLVVVVVAVMVTECVYVNVSWSLMGGGFERERTTITLFIHPSNHCLPVHSQIPRPPSHMHPSSLP